MLNYDYIKPDKNIQAMRFSHGLDAFNGDGSVEKILRNLEGIVNNMSSQNRWELCASAETERLGSVGICVSGKVNLAATQDLYSWVADDGYRSCETNKFKYIVTRADELKPSSMYLPYVEVWVEAHIIHYVWIKKFSEAESFREEFEKLGFEVRLVD